MRGNLDFELMSRSVAIGTFERNPTIKKGPGKSEAFFCLDVGSVTGRAGAGQQNLVDYVYHTVVSHDVGNYHIRA